MEINKQTKPIHCCQSMQDLLEEKKLPMEYNPILREYYIKINSSRVIYCMFYCPWCGSQLPESLRSQWFDIIHDEYLIENPMDDKRRIPKEFRTDEWWKKRGL